MTSPETDRSGRKSYHHGDLRAALLVAAEEELAEKGVEGFTLRGCAKRAGVSHAAPAHHFRDANALLTALATVGFRRFAERQRSLQTLAAPDARSRFAASGLGYVLFAHENPALFRLMFSSSRPDSSDAELVDTARSGYRQLVDDVALVTGRTPQDGREATLDVLASWAVAHGLADLAIAGRIDSVMTADPDVRDREIIAIISRALPGKE